MNDQHVDVKVQVTGLNAQYKQGGFIGTLDWSSESSKKPPEQFRPQIDPDYVMVTFAPSENKLLHDDGGSILIKTKDAKRLALMVGDILIIKVMKEDQS